MMRLPTHRLHEQEALPQHFPLGGDPLAGAAWPLPVCATCGGDFRFVLPHVISNSTAYFHSPAHSELEPVSLLPHSEQQFELLTMKLRQTRASTQRQQHVQKAQSAPRCSLLQLPPEVREMIYHHLFEDFVITLTLKRGCKHKGRGFEIQNGGLQQCGLLLACQTFYKDCIDYFYAHCHFHVVDPSPDDRDKFQRPDISNLGSPIFRSHISSITTHSVSPKACKKIFSLFPNLKEVVQYYCLDCYTYWDEQRWSTLNDDEFLGELRFAHIHPGGDRGELWASLAAAQPRNVSGGLQLDIMDSNPEEGTFIETTVSPTYSGARFS